MRAPGVAAAELAGLRRTLLFALVVTAGILNLVDRQIIAVLKPVISADLGWSDDDYGTLAAWFQGGAAGAFLVTGWIVDRLGVRWANPVGVAAWSVAAMLHGWATTVAQFTAVRVALGATEAMGTPAGVKTVAAVLPPAWRSTGFGVTNAANSLGAILAPLAIPLLAVPFGWRGTFVAAGVAGLAWAALWLLTTRRLAFEPARDPVAAAGIGDRVDHGSVLRDRRTWAVAGAKLLSDATWWLLLFWMPDFFHRQFGLSGVALGVPLAIAYTGAALGSLAGGGVATRLIRRGVPVRRVRTRLMLAAALAVVPVPLAAGGGYGQAVALMALALAGHQAFSTNLFALIADVTPGPKVGRVTAFGAFSGNMGGLVIAKVAGLVLGAGLGYGPLLAFAGVSYLVALGWIRLVLPRGEAAA